MKMSRQGLQRGRILSFLTAVLVSGCGPAAKPQGTSEAPGFYGTRFTVSVSRPDGGTIKSHDGRIDCGPQTSACAPVDYEWSETVTLTATAAPGFRFEGWAADCSGTEPTCALHTAKAKADKTAVAVFIPEAWYPGTYFLVFVTRPVGGKIISADGKLDCGPVATGPHRCGPALTRWSEEMIVTASPSPGQFLGWTGDCIGQSASCSLRISPTSPGDKRIAAQFDGSVAATGGVLESAETGVSLEFPPGAVDQPVVFQVTIPTAEKPASEPIPEIPPQVVPATPIYEIQPSGLTFGAPITAKLPKPPPGLVKKPTCWWSSHGNDSKFEAIGGVEVEDGIECKSMQTSFVFIGEAPETQTRSIRGTKVTTFVRTGNLTVNEPADLSATPVAAYIPRSDGGYDVIDGVGLSDGSFNIPNVPAGSVYVKVGERYVKTSENVVDFGSMVQGRQGRVPVNLTDPMRVQLELDGLEPWDPATHEINVFAPDASSFFYGLYVNALQQGATTLSGEHNLQATRMRITPIHAIDGSAIDGDQIYVMQMTPRTTPTGLPYEAVARAFRGSTTVNPLVTGSLRGTMIAAGQFLSNDVSLEWNYGAFRDAVLQDTPGATIETGRFENRFRVLAQPGSFDLGVTPRQDKRLFMGLPVAADAQTVSTGTMRVGLTNGDMWRYLWAASADARIVVTPPNGGTIWSSASIQQWDALNMTTGRTDVSLGQPLLTPVRDVRVNGAEIMTAPKLGVALPVTLSWTAPRVGPADVYTVIVTHQLRFATGAMDQVAIIDTTDTSIEIPPGVLQSGEAYTFQIRAARRGVDPQRPLRQYLPMIRSTQPTQWFTVD